MTTPQWIFHYKEILKRRNKRDKDIYELIDVLFSSIMNKLEFIGMMANPDLARKILENKKNPKKEEEIKDVVEWFNEIKDQVPETLTVDFNSKKEDKFFLPKYKRRRSLGIEINEVKKAGE